MGNATKKAAAAPVAADAPAEKPKAKRTILSVEEKIAQLEIQAQALREKARSDARAKITKVEADLAKAKDRQAAANTKVEDLERELAGLRTLANSGNEEPSSEADVA